MKLLADGRNWDLAKKDIYDDFWSRSMSFYVALGKNFPDRYLLALPKITNNNIVKKPQELCTTENIEKWKNKLIENKDNVKKEIENAFSDRESITGWIIDICSNEGEKDGILYRLYFFL